jgi:hypothetical protein
VIENICPLDMATTVQQLKLWLRPSSIIVPSRMVGSPLIELLTSRGGEDIDDELILKVAKNSSCAFVFYIVFTKLSGLILLE